MSYQGWAFLALVAIAAALVWKLRLARRKSNLETPVELVRALIDTAAQGVISVDAHGRIVMANRMVEQLFGYSHDQLLAMTVDDLLPEGARKRHEASRAGFFEAPTKRPLGSGLDLRGRRSDGSEFPIDVGLSYVPHGEGTLAVAFIADVTARKAVEQELRLAKEDLERRVAERTVELARERAFVGAVLETVDVGINACDREGRITVLNHALREWHRLVNSKIGATIWEPVAGLYDADGRTPLADEMYPLRRALRGEGFDETELTIRGNDQPPRTIQVSGCLVRDPSGDEAGAVAVWQDVTQRKRSEAALRDSLARLQGVNRELETFSYSVSHDLRAPLRSVDGFSRILLREYAGKALDATAVDYLRRMSAATIRMGHIIEGLLNMSRLTRAPLQVQDVNLSRMAIEIIDSWRQQAPERVVKVQIAPDLMTRGDSRLLRVVLDNLLANAWKFTGRKEQAEIAVGQEETSQGAAFFVRDNGAGFDMQYSHQLFTPFQRMHRADEFEGTGVGLATVQRIIERHAGKIWAESAVERGATFYFTVEYPYTSDIEIADA